MKKKKAQFEVHLTDLILIIIGIAVLLLGIYLLRDKLASLYESIKLFLRFGG